MPVTQQAKKHVGNPVMPCPVQLGKPCKSMQKGCSLESHLSNNMPTQSRPAPSLTHINPELLPNTGQLLPFFIARMCPFRHHCLLPQIAKCCPFLHIRHTSLWEGGRCRGAPDRVPGRSLCPLAHKWAASLA